MGRLGQGEQGEEPAGPQRRGEHVDGQAGDGELVVAGGGGVAGQRGREERDRCSGGDPGGTGTAEHHSAGGCSKLLSADTIYTRKLLRRGIDLHAPERALQRMSVGSAARPLPRPLAPAATLQDTADRFAATDDDALPVVDEQGQLRGVVLATEVQQALSDEADGITAAALAMTVPVLRPDQPLEEALLALTRNGGAGLPVADAEGEVAAWITHRDLLRRAVGARDVPAGVHRPMTTQRWGAS